MKAIIHEYDPRLELWFISCERKVLDITNQSIKLRYKWWQRPKWFPLKAFGMRFEIKK